MLVSIQNFNIKHIADSGQCFRMNQITDEGNKLKYGLVAYGKYLELTQVDDNTVDFSCSEEEYHQIWESYFDLTYDYQRIVKELTQGEDQFLKKAAEFGAGIRILRQEPFEAAISFIISQNKNIPAIKNCVEAISKKYGEHRIHPECGVEYWTFPDAKVLAKASTEELRALKTGYRDTYIIDAAQAVAEGIINFETLMTCSFEDAVLTLKGIHGVGEKVANCIALYGLHKIEGFPVDVWIKRVLKEIYQNNFDQDKYQGYAGIIQQYMFYYMRSLSSN